MNYPMVIIAALILGLSGPAFSQAFDVGVVYATTRYVSPTGNDQTGDGSLARPYSSVARALQNHAPGLKVVLLPGVYGLQGTFAGVQGTAQQPIAVVGQGDVTIDATGGTAGLGFNDPRYLVLENFAIINSPVHGMNIDDGGTYASPGSHVVIRNVRFRQIGTGGNNDCLKMSGIDNFHIEGSEFAGCNIGEAIDMVGCHDGLITANYFHDMPGTAVQAKGGSRNVIILGNRFRNVAGHSINLGGSTGDPYVRPATAPYEGERIQAIANVIEDSLMASVAFLGCNECLVANNTLVNPRRWIARILQGSRDTSITISRAGHFINNIIYYRRADLSTTVNVGPNTEPGTFSFGNNLYFATDGVAFNGDHGSGIPIETASIYQQNPAFANLSVSDFHIYPASPASGRGRNLPFGTLRHFDGDAPGNPPDIGAFKAAAVGVAPARPRGLRIL